MPQDVVGAEVRWQPASLKRHNPKPVRYNRGPTYHGCLRLDVQPSAATYRLIAGTWEGVSVAVTSGDDPPWSSG